MQIPIEWSDKFVGECPEMDDDHREQFEIIKEFCGVCAASADRDQLMGCVDKLIDCSEDHFLREEELLRNRIGQSPFKHAEDHRLLLEELHTIYKLIEET